MEIRLVRQIGARSQEASIPFLPVTQYLSVVGGIQKESLAYGWHLVCVCSLSCMPP